MPKREKSVLRQLIDEHGVKDLAGVQELVKELTSGLIQEVMDAELGKPWGIASTTTRISKRKTVVVDTSWQMIFAKDQAEFDSL